MAEVDFWDSLSGALGMQRVLQLIGDGGHLPLFDVDLDTTEDGHPASAPGMVRLRIMGGSADPEPRMLHAALMAGQFVVEGGYPCVAECGARHGPLAVARSDDPPIRRCVWTIARRFSE